MTPDQHQKILNLLRKNKVAVLSTNSVHEAPQSAAITISEDENLNIFFGSNKTRRKNINIAKDFKVSLVVGWDRGEMETIQIEANAYEIKDVIEIENIKNAHYGKNPESEKYRNNTERVYFRVVPYWIRYSHLSLPQPEVWEVRI